MSHSSTVSPGDAAMRVGVLPSALFPLPCLGEPYRPREPQCGEPVSPTERLPVKQPRREVDRRRQTGQAQPAPLARDIHEIDLEARLHAHAILSAYLPQEREGLVIAAEHHVLSVVDPLSSLRIVERGRAPAEHGLRFEHEDARASRRQLRGGAQARHAGADDDHIGRCHLNGTITFNHVSPAIIA